MKSANKVEAVRWKGDRLELLDQRRLPEETVYVTCRTAAETADAIRDMVVRGAPAIGCAAAFGIALDAKRGADLSEAHRRLAATNIDRFPGHAEAKGLGVAYQRFIFNQFYTALHATWFNQNFFGLNNEKLSSGKQLFLTLRLGYRYSFGSDRFFIEPNLAATFWPINTNLPEAFQKREDNAPKYGVEPGLHVGFVF